MAQTSKVLKRPNKDTVAAMREAEIINFKKWMAGIDTLELPGALHVNGPHFPTAVLTVDFGSPLEPVKFTEDFQTELTNRMRALTVQIIGRDANVRVSTDSNGIWWTSIG